MNKKHIITLFCIFFLLALSSRAWALPPRPDPNPPAPTPEPDPGAGIALRVNGIDTPYWAVVQWQDGLGNWHDVDGWRGEVENHYVIWYVTPNLFGKGPFRWVVYRGDEILGISESFNMPTVSNSLLTVSIEQQ